MLYVDPVRKQTEALWKSLSENSDPRIREILSRSMGKLKEAIEPNLPFFDSRIPPPFLKMLNELNPFSTLQVGEKIQRALWMPSPSIYCKSLGSSKEGQFSLALQTSIRRMVQADSPEERSYLLKFLKKNFSEFKQLILELSKERKYQEGLGAASKEMMKVREGLINLRKTFFAEKADDWIKTVEEALTYYGKVVTPHLQKLADKPLLMNDFVVIQPGKTKGELKERLEQLLKEKDLLKKRVENSEVKPPAAPESNPVEAPTENLSITSALIASFEAKEEIKQLTPDEYVLPPLRTSKNREGAVLAFVEELNKSYDCDLREKNLITLLEARAQKEKLEEEIFDILSRCEGLNLTLPEAELQEGDAPPPPPPPPFGLSKIEKKSSEDLEQLELTENIFSRLLALETERKQNFNAIQELLFGDEPQPVDMNRIEEFIDNFIQKSQEEMTKTRNQKKIVQPPTQLERKKLNPFDRYKEMIKKIKQLKLQEPRLIKRNEGLENEISFAKTGVLKLKQNYLVMKQEHQKAVQSKNQADTLKYAKLLEELSSQIQQKDNELAKEKDQYETREKLIDKNRVIIKNAYQDLHQFAHTDTEDLKVLSLEVEKEIERRESSKIKPDDLEKKPSRRNNFSTAIREIERRREEKGQESRESDFRHTKALDTIRRLTPRLLELGDVVAASPTLTHQEEFQRVKSQIDIAQQFISGYNKTL